MIKKFAVAAALLAASASPAYAVTFVVTPGSTTAFAAPVAAGSTTVDFNGALPTGVTLTGGQLVLGDSAGVYAEPAFSDGSRYLAVLGGQSATLTAAGNFNTASLFLGSVDQFNTVRVLSTAGAVLGSFTGSQLVANADGNQDIARTNVRVTFANEAGEASIGGFQFLSGQNSLETDNIIFSASAVPEPASWAMMIVGVGMVGGSLRRRRSQGNLAYAA